MPLTSGEKLRRLNKALEYGGGTHRIEDVVAMVRGGRAQFWEYRDGSIVTEIDEYPQLKAIRYWLISGALHDCLALEHTINPWAIEQGCTVAMATGRRGWGRVAAPTGWREWNRNFLKPLVGRA